jgi:hypothetical protein
MDCIGLKDDILDDNNNNGLTDKQLKVLLLNVGGNENIQGSFKHKMREIS